MPNDDKENNDNIVHETIPDHEPSQAALDRRGEGPTSLEGVEASDLPDGGRGGVEHDWGHQAARKTPDKTGGAIPDVAGRPERGEVGARGTPAAADADDHAGRGSGGTGKTI